MKAHAFKAMEMKKNINYELVEKVCHAFGATLEVVCGNPDSHIIYPSASYPESLLPYPKTVIKYAVNLWKRYAEENNKKDDVDLMDAILIQLENFIPDNEANEINQKLLSHDTYLQVMFEQKNK